MRYIIIYGIITLMIIYIYTKQNEYEKFYITKCMSYLFISTIHSVIIIIEFPLGAAIMSLLYLADKKNRAVKSKLIIGGIIIVILSVLNYKDISDPLQKLYLNKIKIDAVKIEVYTNNNITNKYLFSITDQKDISKWLSTLKESTSYSSWNYKFIPKNEGYMLKIHYPSKELSVVVTKEISNLPNVFLNKNDIPYTNKAIFDMINEYFSITPLILQVPSNQTEITNKNIIENLWDEILWNNEQSNTDKVNFTIKSIIVLSNKTELEINFSNNFTYLKIGEKQIVKLSDDLSRKLNEQYILSQLNVVSTLTDYTPVHIHTPAQSTMKYSIETDEFGRNYSLNVTNTATNVKTKLHSTSSKGEFIELKSPYVLLYDEKSPDQNSLMLINQNVPDKHRYIVNNKRISANSIAICPKNIKFTYTIDNSNSSSLYLVNDYYGPPITIANGNIQDSLFLSDRLLVYLINSDNNNFLCIYDTELNRTVKYVTVPGEAHFIRIEDNNIIFSIQKKENNLLKEGIFVLNTSFNFKKID